MGNNVIFCEDDEMFVIVIFIGSATLFRYFISSSLNLKFFANSIFYEIFLEKPLIIPVSVTIATFLTFISANAS